MAIPQSFKEKYSLTGDEYEKRNVDLALSDLFSASTRLYADNAELRRQLEEVKAERQKLAAQLNEARSAPAPETAAPVTAMKLDEISRRLDALESKIGANAGVLGEKLSAIAEALSGAVVYTSAGDDLSSDEETLADAEALEYAEEAPSEECTDDHSPEAVSAAIRTVSVEPTLDFSEIIKETTAPKEEIIIDKASEAEEEPMIEEVPEAEEELMIEEAPAESTEPSREEIIKAAGLEEAAEEIEPAEPIPDDSVSSMLAALYSSPAEEPSPAEEEKSEQEQTDAPTAESGKVSGMRSSLDAIRRRREKKK